MTNYSLALELGRWIYLFFYLSFFFQIIYWYNTSCRNSPLLGVSNISDIVSNELTRVTYAIMWNFERIVANKAIWVRDYPFYVRNWKMRCPSFFFFLNIHITISYFLAMFVHQLIVSVYTSLPFCYYNFFSLVRYTIYTLYTLVARANSVRISCVTIRAV